MKKSLSSMAVNTCWFVLREGECVKKQRARERASEQARERDRERERERERGRGNERDRARETEPDRQRGSQADVSHAKCVFKVVWQRSILLNIRQLILYISRSKGRVDDDVRGVTF